MRNCDALVMYHDGIELSLKLRKIPMVGADKQCWWVDMRKVKEIKEWKRLLTQTLA